MPPIDRKKIAAAVACARTSGSSANPADMNFQGGKLPRINSQAGIVPKTAKAIEQAKEALPKAPTRRELAAEFRKNAERAMAPGCSLMLTRKATGWQGLMTIDGQDQIEVHGYSTIDTIHRLFEKLEKEQVVAQVEKSFAPAIDNSDAALTE